MGYRRSARGPIVTAAPLPSGLLVRRIPAGSDSDCCSLAIGPDRTLGPRESAYVGRPRRSEAASEPDE